MSYSASNSSSHFTKIKVYFLTHFVSGFISIIVHRFLILSFIKLSYYKCVRVVFVCAQSKHIGSHLANTHAVIRTHRTVFTRELLLLRRKGHQASRWVYICIFNSLAGIQNDAVGTTKEQRIDDRSFSDAKLFSIRTIWLLVSWFYLAVVRLYAVVLQIIGLLFHHSLFKHSRKTVQCLM